MELLKEEVIDGFTFSTDKKKLDINYVHQFLSQKSYWATGVPVHLVKSAIENALSIGVYDGERQVGFARLVTDYATFGYLADVFIDEAYRGRGLSKQLMEFIFTMEELKVFRRMLLATQDAHGLYLRYGFKPLAVPERFMERHQPDVYKQFNNR